MAAGPIRKIKMREKKKIHSKGYFLPCNIFYLHLVRLQDIYSLKQKDIPSDS